MRKYFKEDSVEDPLTHGSILGNKMHEKGRKPTRDGKPSKQGYHACVLKHTGEVGVDGEGVLVLRGELAVADLVDEHDHRQDAVVRTDGGAEDAVLGVRGRAGNNVWKVSSKSTLMVQGGWRGRGSSGCRLASEWMAGSRERGRRGAVAPKKSPGGGTPAPPGPRPGCSWGGAEGKADGRNDGRIDPPIHP